jgi:hypothetical protein
MALRIEPHLQRLQDALEDLPAAPGVEVVVDRLPRPEPFGEIPPWRPTAQHPEHPIEHRPGIPEMSAGCRVRDQGLDQRPLFIRELVTAHPFCPPILAVRGEWWAGYALRPFSDTT